MEFIFVIVIVVVVVVWKLSKSSGAAGGDFQPAKTRSEVSGEIQTALKRGNSLISRGDELPMGINYMRGEQPIICVANVLFIRNQTEYVAGSAGVSLRVMRGVSVRTGRSKGQRIETPQVLDQGSLIATSKCFYFIGDRNTAKYPYAKLMMCRIDNTGSVIELTKNTANAKTEYFEFGGGGSDFKMQAAYYTFDFFATHPDAVNMSFEDKDDSMMFVVGESDSH